MTTQNVYGLLFDKIDRKKNQESFSLCDLHGVKLIHHQHPGLLKHAHVLNFNIEVKEVFLGENYGCVREAISRQ